MLSLSLGHFGSHICRVVGQGQHIVVVGQVLVSGQGQGHGGGVPHLLTFGNSLFEFFSFKQRLGHPQAGVLGVGHVVGLHVGFGVGHVVGHFRGQHLFSILL